ncbi:MAG: MFS transporter [Acidimicrobiia bacterium]|nr:MFS transporter [Acidimicrobiia bacterium]
MTPPPVWPVVLAGFTAFINLYAPQPLLPSLTRVFHTTPFGVSLTITLSTIAVAVAAPLVGQLADRIGRRRVIIGSSMLLAVATALAATSSTLPQLLAWRTLQGLLTPGVFAVTIAYIHDRWPVSHTGRATGAYVSGTVTGGFSGRAVAGVVASQVGWQAAFLTLAGMIAAAAAALWVWLPPEPGRTRRAAASGTVRRLLAHKSLMATNAVGFCVLFTQVASFTYVTFHLAEPPFSLSTIALGWLFVVYLFGAAVTPIAGRWSDRFGHRAALGGGVAVGVVGALATLAPWLPAVVLGLAFVATGVFIAQATASSYIGAVTAEDRGLAVGLYSTFYYLGGSAGGAVPAAFWQVGGWPATVLLVLAVQASTFGIAWRFWRPAPAPTTSAAATSAVPPRC